MALGVLLAIMLIGIAALIEKFAIAPVEGVTVLAQVTQASLGDGPLFYLVQFATVILLALAANTSFGGLPVLAQLLAADNNLPHFFALRADRHVHRYGIAFLTVASAALLVLAEGEMNLRVPLFAIGVFVGFTLSQGGMVKHWVTARPAGGRWRAALNGFGALLTFLAAIVVTVSKFTEGGWLVVVTLPLMVLVMERINRSYARIGRRLEVGRTRCWPARCAAVPTWWCAGCGSGSRRDESAGFGEPQGVADVVEGETIEGLDGESGALDGRDGVTGGAAAAADPGPEGGRQPPGQGQDRPG
ncbi:hypothetical protein Acor_06630 [Acrocarpospora corrugata]|uniref:Amino acid permease/ SLC12A domain-containing protein n=1 Tax=Acrocarpospora corrugata TaxID=35763 RepID=A0A5M3VSJ6_9ACTN|nr:hypothetical protein Acor_06630 [Acrocarpospora corrugata]